MKTTLRGHSPATQSGSAVGIALARRAAIQEGRRIRTAAGLTIYDLAADLGVSPATVSRWESGLRVPRSEAALRYADLLAELAKVAQ